MADERKAVVRLLVRLDEDKAYSNILLDRELTKSQLGDRQKHFATALFYGVIERKLTLDKIIDDRLVRKKDRLSAEVRNILRCGIYQLLYMDSVADHTAVDESVKLAQRVKNPAIPGFVNGLLRGFIRDGKQLPNGKNGAERLVYEYSCPLWLVEKWYAEYGEDTARAMLSSSCGRAPVTVRVNTVKSCAEDAIKTLEDDGIKAVKDKNIEDCLIISGGDIEKTDAFKKGLCHVQDISSQLCCKALDARPGMTVLDLCAAPGGKSFTIAEHMENRGTLSSFDLHDNRVRLIRSGAERLGLDIIDARANNAKIFDENIGFADRVLCDVPCSGLGVIRRKPEIKYKDPSEFERLPQIQYEILECSSGYVKKGGVLVYSTCTLSRAENDEVVDRFLSLHSDFSMCELGEPFINECKASITPDRFGSDGFFIAKLKRSESL